MVTNFTIANFQGFFLRSEMVEPRHDESLCFQPVEIDFTTGSQVSEVAVFLKGRSRTHWPKWAAGTTRVEAKPSGHGYGKQELMQSDMWMSSANHDILEIFGFKDLTLSGDVHPEISCLGCKGARVPSLGPVWNPSVIQPSSANAMNSILPDKHWLSCFGASKL